MVTTGCKDDVCSPIPPEIVRDIRHAYYASITYVDEQIGRVLQVFMGVKKEGEQGKES